MTARLGHGTITGGGPAVKVGAALLPLPATHERLADWVAELDDVQPCPHCGVLFGCDCIDWLEWMLSTSTPRPLDELTEEDIPY